MISYFYDIYSCLIILIFQIGIVIRHENLKNVGNQITLILCVYTAVCLVYTIVIDRSIFTQNMINKEDVQNIYADYNTRKEVKSLYYDIHRLKT